MHKIPSAISVGLLNLTLLVPQCIITYFMKAGNDKLSTLQITCSVQTPPILRLGALRKKLCQTSLKHASPAATESTITIVDGVLQERSI